MAARLGLVLQTLHFLYPLSVFAYQLVSSCVAVVTLDTLKAPVEKRHQHVPRRLFVKLVGLLALTFIAQVSMAVGTAIRLKQWLGPEDLVVQLLACTMIYVIQMGSLSQEEYPVWYPYCGTWIISLVFELTLGGLGISFPDGRLTQPQPLVNLVSMAVRIVTFIVMVGLFFARRNYENESSVSDAECQPLLQDPDGHDGDSSQAENQNGNYGSTGDTSGNAKSKKKTTANENPYERREREGREKLEKRLKEDGNWFTYMRRFTILWPLIWPVGNRRLQLCAGGVVVCLLSKNVLNVLLPRQMGLLMDTLGGVRPGNPWIEVLVYGLLRFLSSESGVDFLRNRIYFPLEYFSRNRMATEAYAHILHLSADFHDSQSSSDTILAVRAGETISDLVDRVFFSAAPRVLDLVIAVIYLSLKFGAYQGLITIATAVGYLHMATALVGSMKGARREQITTYYEMHNLLQSGIEGWHTVTSFNQVGYENNRHTDSVLDYTAKTKTLYFKWFKTHALQSLVLLAGMISGAFLVVGRIRNGEATPGDFVMLLAYWGQLTGPLMYFSHLGKQLNNDLIHAERLLELLEKEPTVQSKPKARPIKYKTGKVEFDKVAFTYDTKKGIIKDLSLTVEGGKTVAFVGATGAGKSTVLKLLSRLYDVTGGSIRIDGQDIRDVDLQSLRQMIGSVPQSPVLFNDTVMANIQYANRTASEEEVYEACRAACIHDKILSFTDGYQTRVGERGVKLSGGELQRVAIARAILKNPRIVLLDEATSSVDTDTEHRIQTSLGKLCAGRTTFVVAHRLSTVMNADSIIVLDEGTILEAGDHETLIRTPGKYADLWSKQIFMKAKKSSETTESSTPETLINDLEPDIAELELAKIASTSASTDDLSAKDEDKADSKTGDDGQDTKQRDGTN